MMEEGLVFNGCAAMQHRGRVRLFSRQRPSMATMDPNIIRMDSESDVDIVFVEECLRQVSTINYDSFAKLTSLQLRENMRDMILAKEVGYSDMIDLVNQEVHNHRQRGGFGAMN